MPQTYSQRRREQSQRPGRRTSSPPEPDNSGFLPSSVLDGMTDADDAIFLSDLVRTGEASRLRRRGAMRIDHSHPHHSTSVGHTLSGAPIRGSISGNLNERASWDSDEELDSPVFASHSNAEEAPIRLRRHPRMSRRFGPYSLGGSSSISSQTEVQDDYTYTIVCGAEISDWEQEDLAPFQPSILPLYPPSSPSSSSLKKVNKSTGCGAVLHLHAAPKPKFKIWTARSSATDSVVPLDSRYFDSKEAAGFSRSSCGCVKEGVGCAACGSVLGTRYTPCPSASDGLFCPRLPEKRSSNSMNSNSYLESSSLNLRSASKSKHQIFTFSADAVTSTPAYTFSSSSRSTRSRSSFESFSASPNDPRRLSSSTHPQGSLFYPHDEDDHSDSENFPPYLYGAGWRSIAGTGFSSGLDINMMTILDSPVTLRPPPESSGVLLDRLANASPVPDPEATTANNPVDHWAVEQSTIPPPSPPPPLRTRTGRTARRSSSARLFPSLSSGLGGNNSVITRQPSFYERQLRNASERELLDFQNAEPGPPFLVDTPTSPDLSSSPPSFALDADGDMLVWGVNTPETTLNNSDMPWGSRMMGDDSGEAINSSREDKPLDGSNLDTSFLDR
ncbi:hypothetical protein CPB83DRAFT_843061 [Crepidotus variabilis]|uniref:Uncharacterized protein n=1 Tax=Crepidotus variabilis TaxID=179855 RepID=A0A9P6JUZ5_9AGAR|nr:hypothetical protein CPB83DRAFT_843061 [Crepidotus variabilis]